MSDEEPQMNDKEAGPSGGEVAANAGALLAKVEAEIETEKAKIRETLSAVGGDARRLSPGDRAAYTAAAAIVRAIGRLRFVHAVGAIDDIQAAVDDLKGELLRRLSSSGAGSRDDGQ
jgi:hypothetical protein